MGDLLAGGALDGRARTEAAARPTKRPGTLAPPRAAGRDHLGAIARPEIDPDATALEGFAIDAVLASARTLAARIAAGAPDLAVTVHDPRATFRAWFRRRSDPRLFFPEALGAALAPRFAASPRGEDRLHPAAEIVLPLDAGSAELADAEGPVLPPCRVATEWVDDHELAHLADRAITDRRIWFEQYDPAIKHRREILADGFAHVLAILRHGDAGEREAQARADGRAHHLLTQGDAAHFTTYAAGPFIALGRSLRARGARVETIEPLALARRCREIAAALALAPAELEAIRERAVGLRHATDDRPDLPPHLDRILADARAGADRYRCRSRRRAVPPELWLAAMTRANPDDAALLHAARTAVRLERSAHELGTVLGRPAGGEEHAREAHGRVVAAFLGTLHGMIGRTLPFASGEAAACATRLGTRAVGLGEGLLRAAHLSAAEWTATFLLTLQEALSLAWEGIEHGLLPGPLDSTIRAHMLSLAGQVRVFLAGHGAA